MAKKRIGIDALFQTSVPAAVPEPASTGTMEYREVEIDRIHPGPRQPRRFFDEAALEQLVASIRAQGVLQPLLVRATTEPEQFEIVAGERRWRAGKAAGLDRLPVRVVELDDQQAVAVAIVENLQREDLSPIEEAEGYLELLRAGLEREPLFAEYRDESEPLEGVTRVLRALSNRAAGNTKDNVVLSLEPRVAEVFASVGRITWQSFTTHRLPLLSMPPELTAVLRNNQIPYTKARHIARLTAERLGVDESQARKIRRDMIEQAITEGLSVRSLQNEISRYLGGAQAEKSMQKPFGRKAPRRTGLGRRLDDLADALRTVEIEDLGPARRAEISAAIEALLKLL
jgi:ParB family chromosome partitioning protein